MSINESLQLKTVVKAYKTRIYPTISQIEQIEKSFGASRFIYNFFLNQNKERLQLDEYTLGYKRESEILTFIKKDTRFLWLNESDKFSLQNAIKDQDRAFSNFFSKRAKFPKFHSKKDSYQSYTILCSTCTKINFSQNSEIFFKFLGLILKSNFRFFLFLSSFCDKQLIPII